MVERIKIGVIGCGVAATRDVLPNLIQPEIARKGIELVAVCDTLESRAKETMRTFGAREAYVDYKEMLAKSDINAVAIFTPINLHYSIAMASAQAGKHVYVQKTMTTTLEEANNLLSTTRANSVKLVASPGQMHNPSLRMAKNMLKRGLVGKPLWGQIISSTDGHLHETTDPSWYYKPGGGPLYPILVYWVTTFCWMLGSVKKVTALSGIAIPTRWWKNKRINNEMDDSTMILMDFGGSTFVSAISNFCAKGILGDSSIYGTDGVIHIPLAALRSTQTASRHALMHNTRLKIEAQINQSGGRKKGWIEWSPPLFPSQYHLAAPSGAHIVDDILEFADCILKDKEPMVASGKHARHIIEVFEKAYISAKTGKTQQLETTFS